jgi:hypothetical protein
MIGSPKRILCHPLLLLLVGNCLATSLPDVLPAVDHSHWAFQPVSSPTPPDVKQQKWVRNPIDRFILSRLESADLPPAPPASRSALLRRAYYDLTGLPPSPEQVASYLARVESNDSHNAAYEEMIDHLLDSPQYGERWGRHWLDLVRYAETDSYERDNPKPNAWKYRDYVIRSFNDDKPYDQFIREQLAGDEIPERSYETVIATGYYRLGLWDDEPVDPLQAYYDHLDDVVSTTSEVFLGLTINCARCHDHKIDPISQRDYYRFTAFFHNILNNVKKGEYEDFAFTLNTQTPLATAEEQANWKNQKQQHEKLCAELKTQIDQLEQKVIASLSKGEQDDANDNATVRKRLIHKNWENVLSKEDQTFWKVLQEQRAEADKTGLAPLPHALAVQENGNLAPDTFVMSRGNARALGDQVVPGFPTVLNVSDPVLSIAPVDSTSCGRRTVLANWIASPANRLTSRVIVNRVWQHHFGRGIVDSPSNFGLGGSPPTHPLLLNWLANQFVNDGWRLKSLHRLIMTSSAYRMSSGADNSVLASDPKNRLFSRQSMRRLSAEELRDSMLAVSGRLNLQMYGPSIFPELSPEVLQTQSQPGAGWNSSSPEQQTRRTIYVHIKRSLIPPMIEAFDGANPDNSCPVRFSTTQPTQALELLNGNFSQKQSQQLAARIRDEVGDNPDTQVQRALWLVTQRSPTNEEIVRGVNLLQDLVNNEQVPPSKAFDVFCLMALNLNEFLFLD